MTLRGIFISLIFLAVFSLFYNIYLVLLAYKVPKIGVTWWGPGEPPLDWTEDTEVIPFELTVPEKILDEIQLQINQSRPFTPPFESIEHQYGLNTNQLNKFLKFLQHSYKPHDRLAYLNKFPQFTTKIQGLKVHFLHVKSNTSTTKNSLRVYPILLLHGWPSSVLEFYEMVPILTNPQPDRGFVFDVVVAALPGFGYSDGAAKANCTVDDLAVVMKSLMTRLGYQKFFIHGSDWGSAVAQSLAVIFPENTLGYHSNFCYSLRRISFVKMFLGSLWPSAIMPSGYEDKLYPLYKIVNDYIRESGYFHLQATKPDTIGIGLENSLPALISFTFEKLSIGTNLRYIHKENAGLEDQYDLTQLMDNIFFYYWLPKSATTSARIYAENFHWNWIFFDSTFNVPVDVSVPCGCAFFEHDFVYQPETVLRDKLPNLIQFNHYKVGGHFAALEESAILVNDILEFIAKATRVK